MFAHESPTPLMLGHSQLVSERVRTVVWVRAPSPRARRLLDACGLAGLIDEHRAPVRAATRQFEPPVASTQQRRVLS